MRLRWLSAALAVTLLAAASCDDGPQARPGVEIIGGGFIINYREAEAFYGLVARVTRAVPTGTVIEAEFEDPGGGSPFLVTDSVRQGQRDYTLRTPPVVGIVADRDYRVRLRLRDPASREVITGLEKSFRSSVDQGVVPRRPLTVGPGYHPNPEAEPGRSR